MRYAKKMCFIIYVGVLTFVLLEGLVRWWGYAEHYITDPIYMRLDEDSEIAYVHRPNLVNARARGGVVLNTDVLGLRTVNAGDVYGPKEPEEYRIVVVGDSVTFGEGVSYATDTFAEVLERSLNAGSAHEQYEVFNFGVSGYSTREMAATVEERILPLEPDLLLVALVPQDLDLMRTGIVDEWGYLVSQRPSVTPAPWPWLKRPLREVRLVYVLRDFIMQIRQSGEETAVWENSTYESPDGYAFLTRINSFAQANQLECRFVTLPVLGFAGYFYVIEQFNHYQLPLWDFSHLAANFTPEQFAASPFDAHPSALVHHAIGLELASSIQSFWAKR